MGGVMRFESDEARKTYKREGMRRWRAANPERSRETGRRADAKRDHAVRCKQWYLNNYDKRLAFRKANLDRWAANEARRRAARNKATPPWVDHKKIEAIYREAYEMRVLGFDVEVDHIHPLRGKTVCGLHVHTNLQIIPAEANRRKGNRFV